MKDSKNKLESFARKAIIDSVYVEGRLVEINQKSNVFQTKSKQMLGGCDRNSLM